SAGAALKALTPALPEEALESAKRRARGIALRELPAHGERSVTRRYLSAVTCKGPTAFYGTVEALADKVYLLDNECGLAPVLLEELAVSARTRAICCMEPIFGRQIEHLILPDLGLALVSDSALVPYEGPCSRHLRLDAALPSSVRKEARVALKTASELIDRAVEELRAAKAHHDRLESLYNPYVDFDGVRQSAREEAFRLFK
ncbi:MAG: hypothetical protein II794_03485, partial [Oscillospiraceae bacterium]|nr:hypothetical protein [Oscillospiraceae bacterium]